MDMHNIRLYFYPGILVKFTMPVNNNRYEQNGKLQFFPISLTLSVDLNYISCDEPQRIFVLKFFQGAFKCVF